MHGMLTRLTLEGCIISAASTPSKAPSRAINSLPPPRSSAGVPSMRTRPGKRARERRERERGAERRGGDQVVAAGVADAGQRVVLGEQRHAGAARAAELGGEGRLEPVGARLDAQPAFAQRGYEQRRRLAFFERQLRMRMDRARDAQQRLARRLDGIADFLLERAQIHRGLGGGDAGHSITGPPGEGPRFRRRAV